MSTILRFRAAMAVLGASGVVGLAGAEAPATQPASQAGLVERAETEAEAEAEPVERAGAEPASQPEGDASDEVGVDVGRDDAAALPEVRVRAQNVNFSESIQFDDSGNEQHRHSNMHVNLRVRLVGGDESATYVGMEVTSVLTSSGERLTTPNQNHWQNRHPIMNRHRHHGNGREFSSGFQLSVPTVTAEELAEVRGVVRLTRSAGEVKQAALMPISMYDGKPVRVVGVEGATVTVRRLPDQRRVRVEFPLNGPPLEGATFLDAERQLMPTPQHWGGGHSNDRAHQDYQVLLPDGGGVLLRWRGRMEEVEVPFTVTNVPLPGPRRVGVELSVVARPLGDLDPLAGLELLDVEVVEEN